MANFKSWVQNKTNQASRFLRSTGNHLRTGVRFLNSTVVPNARKGVKLIGDVNAQLQQDANVSVKNKERLNKFNKLSELGLQRLSDTNDTVQRVASVV